MPYFGATTLHDVYKDLKSLPRLPDSGKGLISTLNARRSTLEADSAVHGSWPGPDSSRRKAASPLNEAGAVATVPALTESPHTLRVLEKFTYVQAVLWLGARLADGLAHAHERGIYHRDLKPANVLLTDEGQPMLLDFNLSADSKLRSSASAAVIGGTLPYMPPEQLEAFRGASSRTDAAMSALGIILYGSWRGIISSRSTAR